MNLIQCYLKENDCYKTGRAITPKGVMVHSTGANNPKVARYVQPADSDPNKEKLLEVIGTNKNKNDWNKGGLDVCTHAFIGKLADNSVGTVQTLPWDRRGWHAGTGTSGGSANNTHIAFEICEDALTSKTYFNKVYQEAVELTAMLCKQYNLNPMADGVVICHSEGYTRGIASNHADVMHWFPKHGKSMDTFRSDVSKAMEGTNGGNTSTSGGNGVENVGITEGSVVRVKPGAKDYTGGGLASYVYTRDHVVSEVSGDRCVITFDGIVVAAVHIGDLTLVSGDGAASGDNQEQVPANTSYRVRVIAKNGLNCRTAAGIGAPKVTAFCYGTELTVTKEQNGWGYVGKGWVSLTYVEKVSDAKTYTIQAGDTLGEIAERFGTTVDTLAKANGIKDKNLIIAGNTMIIP